MKKINFNYPVLIRLVLIFSIAAAAIGQCHAQAVQDIGTQPVSYTDPVTLTAQPTFPVQHHEVDPITRRLTFKYEAVSERKNHGLKNFVRKLRRVFHPNAKI